MSGARGIGQRGTLRLASLRRVLCGFAGRAEDPDVTAPPSNRSRCGSEPISVRK